MEALNKNSYITQMMQFKTNKLFNQTGMISFFFVKVPFFHPIYLYVIITQTTVQQIRISVTSTVKFLTFNIFICCIKKSAKTEFCDSEKFQGKSRKLSRNLIYR